MSDDLPTRLRALAAPLGLAIPCLAVAAGLLALRSSAHASFEAAAFWTPTPCVIERGVFLQTDGEAALDLVYRYEVDGQVLRGDRLDLVPGRFGDDDRWERQLMAAHPEGSVATCFVDPSAPEEAVLDREHGRTQSERMLLLAFPFGFVGGIFLVGAFLTLFPDRSGTEPPLLLPAGLPPRAIPRMGRLGFIAESLAEATPAWLFLVGFVLFFRMVDGPAHLADWTAAHDRIVPGQIVEVEARPGNELWARPYAVLFRFTLDGIEHEGRAHTRGARHQVGDVVDVHVDRQAPEAAVLEGARRPWSPAWVAMIPGVVVLLLAFGIVASLVFRIRCLPIIRFGLAVPPRSPLAFEANGTSFEMDPRSPAKDAESPAEILVFYDPTVPARNVALGPKAQALLRGERHAVVALRKAIVISTLGTALSGWLWRFPPVT